MADSISFAEWLKGQLKERKMSQAELAKKSGLGKSVINRIIHQGIKRPDAFTYVELMLWKYHRKQYFEEQESYAAHQTYQNWMT